MISDLFMWREISKKNCINSFIYPEPKGRIYSIIFGLIYRGALETYEIILNSLRVEIYQWNTLYVTNEVRDCLLFDVGSVRTLQVRKVFCARDFLTLAAFLSGSANPEDDEATETSKTTGASELPEMKDEPVTSASTLKTAEPFEETFEAPESARRFSVLNFLSVTAAFFGAGPNNGWVFLFSPETSTPRANAAKYTSSLLFFSKGAWTILSRSSAKYMAYCLLISLCDSPCGDWFPMPASTGRALCNYRMLVFSQHQSMIEVFTFCELNATMTLVNYIAFNPNLVNVPGKSLAIDELHVPVQRLVKIVELAEMVHVGKRISGDYSWNLGEIVKTISSVIFHDQFLSLILRKGVRFGDIFNLECNALKSVTQCSQLTKRNYRATTPQKTWQKTWQLISQRFGSDNEHAVRNSNLVTILEEGSLRKPLDECAWMEKALSLDIINM